MLRQDPAECLFSFICSSNNHISRIHGMVERLCATYGTPLVPDTRLNAVYKAVPVKKTPTPRKKKRADDEELKEEPSEAPSSPKKTPTPTPTPAREHSPAPVTPSASLQSSVTDAVPEIAGEPLGAFYAFPTVSQLLRATEEELRGMGFGYRAKFIAGTAAVLSGKEGGADFFLKRLRDETPYREAQSALAELPGVGPKVAACACLFSLDKHCAVPVDTHVWQLAIEHYVPDLQGKTLTPKIMEQVEDAIVEVFGEFAGWAHNTLFVAELAHVRAALPEELRTPPRAKAVKKEKLEGVQKEERTPKMEWVSETIRAVNEEEEALESPRAKKQK
jgi:N-glycosylase/DNA lyase